MGNPVFKNEKAIERQEEWYQKFLVRAGRKVHIDYVKTSFGDSHILFAGEEDNPPIICLHAMLTSSAHLLSEIRELTEQHYLIIPDIPGHSVNGIYKRFSYEDESYVKWLQDIFEALTINSPDLLGVSLGGFVARKFASAFPQKVNKLVLVVPAGIVQGSVVKGLMKMAVPMLKYKFNQSEANLRAVVNFLLSNWDEDWAYYLGDAMNDFITPKKIPPLATDEELKNLKMPCLVIGEDEDISFPGKLLVDRVQALIPNAETELLHGRHSPPTTDEFRDWFATRVRRFLINTD
jgi:pimeloyl-ACP methyl ester carboxylesterase